MAQFVFDIPDTEAERIATAVCAAGGYAPMTMEDAQEFTKNWIFRLLARIVLEQEAGQAANQARDAVYANSTDPLAQALLTEQ